MRNAIVGGAIGGLVMALVMLLLASLIEPQRYTGTVVLRDTVRVHR